MGGGEERGGERGGGGGQPPNHPGKHECIMKGCNGLQACMSTHTAGRVWPQRSTDMPAEGTILDSRS